MTSRIYYNHRGPSETDLYFVSYTSNQHYFQHTMDYYGGNIKKDTGYLCRMLFELFSGKKTIEESLGCGTVCRLQAFRAHTSRIWRTSSADMRPQNVLQHISVHPHIIDGEVYIA